MKVLHISTIDIGGAYKAALRLNCALSAAGIDSNILLRTKVNDENLGKEFFTNCVQKGISKVKNMINMFFADGKITRDVLGTDISKHFLVQEADIIILHWINSFLTPREIKKILDLHKPVIWFMHDMWSFTGGCHYDLYCGRYESKCGNCPMVKRLKENDISHINFYEKNTLVSKCSNIFFAGPSQWMINCAKKSSITKNKDVLYLPNMIDNKIYKYIKDRDELCERYKLNKYKKIILFGAADAGTENEIKGFKYLLKALNMLSREEYQLAVFGNAGNNIKLPKGFEVALFGFVSDEGKLAEIYSLADVLANPSQQEAFGYTACEAMACGTPVVAFPIGGLKEQITHMENGYLAKYHDSDDLAKGIMYCANNKQKMSLKAVEAASKYSYQNAVGSYIRVFEELMKK